jgi:hypothetical protein
MTNQCKSSVVLLAVAIGFAAAEANAESKKTIIGGKTGNGDFNADASDVDARQFQHTDHWYNLATSEAGPTATKNNKTESDLFMGDGTRHALLIKGPIFINDSGHKVAAAGEVFQISLDFCDSVPKWNDNKDAVEVFFVTSKVKLDGYTEAKDITEISSVSFSKITKDGKFETYQQCGCLYDG